MSRYTKHAPEDFPYEEYLPVANVDEYDAIGRLGKLEDIFYAPDGSELVTLDRLRELVEADRDGRCVVLPCKVGDTVYMVAGSEIVEAKVTEYVVTKAGISIVRLYSIDDRIADYRYNVFTAAAHATRAEAEEALAKEGT